MNFRNKYLTGLLILIAILFFSCKSTKGPETRSVDEIFKNAVVLYNNEEYTEAKNLFDIIKLQYPASQYTDDAQFYISQIYYNNEQYILAAFNFNRLRSNYPSSPYKKESLYKAAMCYYELSPSFDRDQEYTLKAIDAMNLFQRFYPNDTTFTDINKYIQELRNKLAEREYFTAGLYIKMNSPISALVYYDTIIDDYPDTKFYEPAQFGKIEVLYKLQKYEEAKSIIDLYKRNFPDGPNLDKIKDIERSIDAEFHG